MKKSNPINLSKKVLIFYNLVYFRSISMLYNEMKIFFFCILIFLLNYFTNAQTSNDDKPISELLVSEYHNYDEMKKLLESFEKSYPHISKVL